MGIEDSVSCNNYTKMVTCMSQKGGELLQREFEKFVQNKFVNTEQWQELEKVQSQKADYESKIKKVEKKMKFLKTVDTEKQFIQEHEKIKPYNFLRPNFCSDPPNCHVAARVI